MLAIRGLRKSFGGRTVLDGFDLTVEAGEFVALLGPNGSGKSTALRCVVGLETPDGGSVSVDGNAAMVFQKIHLVGRRTALDNVCSGALGRRCARLSGGQQQRVAIARALCQRANVILADEPVSALDPQAAVQVMEVLVDLANEGLAVVAVLHQPELARTYAHRIVEMGAFA